MTDRAQSTTLGFVLVFALVLGAMSLITVAGMAELQDVRDAERLNNAERAFKTLDSNVEDLVEGGVSSQATEISLSSARVSTGDPITVTVSGSAVADPTRQFSYDITVHPIVYETEGESDTKLVYAAGQVFRQQRDGTVMLDDLDFLLSADSTNLLVVQTRPSRSGGGIGGSTTALVRTVRANSELFRANRTAYDMTVTVDSPRAEGWYRALDEKSVTTCSMPSESTTTCSFTTQSVYVTVARVDVGFE